MIMNILYFFAGMATPCLALAVAFLWEEAKCFCRYRVNVRRARKGPTGFFSI